MKTRKTMIAVSLILLLVSSSLPAAAELVNMEFKQAPLVDVFQILGQLGGYNVLVDPSVSGQVTFALKDLTVEDALDLVTRTTGYRYKLMGNTLVVASDERLKTEFGSQDFRFIQVEHVGVEAAQRLVTLVIPQIKTYVDGEQNLLVLYGLSTDLEMAASIVRQYDQKSYTVPLVPEQPIETGEPGEKLQIGAVPVFYGDGAEILEAARRRWPLRELRFDQQTGNIMGQMSAEEWPLVEAFVIERDLPDFLLKGLLGTQGQRLALVEYKGEATLLKEGELFHDWLLCKIEDGQVEFRLNERPLIIRIGR